MVEAQKFRDREHVRLQLIGKVGPWAFQSYKKEKWANVSDDELIVGSLLKGKPEDRYMLLELFDEPKLFSVWQKEAVVQDKWYHESNVWAAKNIFNAPDPEKFVRENYRIGRSGLAFAR